MYNKQGVKKATTLTKKASWRQWQIAMHQHKSFDYNENWNRILNLEFKFM